MRAELGSVAAHGLLLATGMAVVLGLGVVRPTPRGMLAGAGLAYLAGAGSVVIVLTALLTVGIPFGLPTFVAVSVVIAAAGLGAQRLLPATAGPTGPWTRADRVALGALAAGLGVFLFLGLLEAGVEVVRRWDAFSIWTPKAVLLFESGQLNVDYFEGPGSALAHPEYPIGFPLLQAIQFRAMGEIGPHAPHIQAWVLVIAFLWGLAYLAAQVGRPLLWAPIVLAAALAPGVHDQAMSALADIPMGAFLVIAALLVGMWVTDHRPAHLILGALMLGSAANMKGEGLLWSVAVLAAAALVLALERNRRRVLQVAAATAGFALAVAPWRLWAAVHGLAGDLKLSQGLDPVFVFDRIDRIDPAVRGIVGELGDGERWLLLVPLAVGLVVSCLLLRTQRTVAGYYAAAAGFTTVLLIWWFMIRPLFDVVPVTSSVDRYVTGLVFICLAAAVHLAGRMSEPET